MLAQLSKHLAHLHAARMRTGGRAAADGMRIELLWAGASSGGLASLQQEDCIEEQGSSDPRPHAAAEGSEIAFGLVHQGEDGLRVRWREADHRLDHSSWAHLHALHFWPG